jgi:hypothetical protein
MLLRYIVARISDYRNSFLPWDVVTHGTSWDSEYKTLLYRIVITYTGSKGGDIIILFQEIENTLQYCILFHGIVIKLHIVFLETTITLLQIVPQHTQKWVLCTFPLDSFHHSVQWETGLFLFVSFNPIS